MKVWGFHRQHSGLDSYDGCDEKVARVLKFLRPRQIMVLDAIESGARSQRMTLRPTLILLVMVLLMLTAAAATYMLLPDNSPAAVSQRHELLRQDNQSLRYDLAEARAELAIKIEYAVGLQADMLKLRESNVETKRQLLIYENILEARKSKGIHIINGAFNWRQGELQEAFIAYKFALVNGSDGSRRSKGKVKMVAIGREGQKHQFETLPYKMETHLFLEGLLQWQEDWSPKKIVLTHVSSKKVLGHRLEITVGKGRK
ncbi:MAG: hypothetical protein R8M38_07505 [Mariprofundaceae bacterium]